MSQDRRRPTQPGSVFDPLEPRRLQLAPYAAGTKSTHAESGHLAALLQLLSENGIDCSVIVEAADEEGPRTVH
ncbi:MAG TPA: hypothetical protein VK438_17120 [Xanthobacteraceae bacterium]|nr:hypothetical protein [Xanthobacteraceae bacterium]